MRALIRRIPRPRFTMKHMMGVLLAVGVFAHLGLSAWRVYPGKGTHLHSWIVVENGVASPCFDPDASAPFFSLYLRCILGLPWRGQAVCGGGRGEIEACSLESPEMDSGGTDQSFLSWSQIERLRRSAKPEAPWATEIPSIRIVIRNRLPHSIHQVETHGPAGYRLFPFVDAGGEASFSRVGPAASSEVTVSFTDVDQGQVETRGRLHLLGSERGVLTFEVTPAGVRVEGAVTDAGPSL